MAIRLMLFAALVAAACSSSAQEAPLPDGVEAAIRSAAEQYVEASNRGDAKALRAAWTAEGDYIDATGNRTKASELLADVTPQSPDEAGARSLSVELLSVRQVQPDVVVEDGISTRSDGDGSTSRTRYTAVWVKQDGRWLLDAVREAPAVEDEDDNPLLALDGIVGSWVGEIDDLKVLFKVYWIEDGKFLERDLTFKRGDKQVLHSRQTIGWDAAEEAIKSSSVDSLGGRGESTWMNEGDAWKIDTLGVLGDGREVHSISKLEQNADGTLTWTLAIPATPESASREATVQLKRVD